MNLKNYEKKKLKNKWIEFNSWRLKYLKKRIGTIKN